MESRVIKIYIKSMGCKANLYDTASIVDLLPEDSFELVDAPDLADSVILNTCAVTHKADRDSRKFLGSLASRLPELPVFVTGCGAVTQSEVFSEYPNVKQVLLPGSPKRMAELLGAVDMLTEDKPEHQNPLSPFTRLGRKRAFIKVQDGCNAKCTYCIIPRLRGPQRSSPVAKVRSELRRLTKAGHRELVLTGIHLGRYGADLSGEQSLASLLDALASDLQGSQVRVRLSSIEPREWTEELIDSIHRHDFVCRHFHVPLQSGHDDILHLMARPYTVRQYQDTIDRLRRAFPQAAIGADILVGFPGESDEMANSTAELVAALSIDYFHVFTFSSRPGTPAASMDGKVSSERIKLRAKRLREIGEGKWERFTCSGVGKFHMLLGEKLIDGGIEGRSEQYRKLRLPDHDRLGELIEVRAISQRGDTLLCDPVREYGD